MSEIEQQSNSNSPPGRRRTFLFRAFVILVFLLALECTARFFWIGRGVPFFTAQQRIYRSFYPQVAEIERNPPVSNDDCFDILLLGGSVLHQDYGNIEHVLLERLIRETQKCVKVHNVAAPAHTSLDSAHKYAHLSALPFDLILVYHGINETRANNCEAEVFQNDYSHMSWYRLINRFESSAKSRWFVLPYTAYFVGGKFMDRLGWSNTLPIHRPSEDSTELGCDVKTAEPFRENIESILSLAKSAGHKVLLMTFAHHSPVDYSEQRFNERNLDYTAHTFATELWGKSECVVKAIDSHNERIQQLVEGNDGRLFINQNAQIPREGLYFNDICHFTHEGCERFVENLLPAILPMVRELR